MAVSSLPSPWNFLSPVSKTHSSNSFKTLNVKVCCSDRTGTQQIEPTSKKRKPRPSFLDQIHDKWSVKTVSQREKFPWQEQQEKREQIEEEEEETRQSYGILVTESETGNNNSEVSDSLSFGSRNRVILAPWVQKNKSTKPQFDYEARDSQKTKTVSTNSVEERKILKRRVSNERGISKIDEIPKKDVSPIKSLKLDEETYNVEDLSEEFDSLDFSVEGKSELKSGQRLPWEKGKSDEGNRLKVEKMIPEFELKRLRNIALRMLERIKVGAAGITEELVKSIHEKWKESEVVKLKFEGPPAMNMKRTHEILESRTGGLVIWRSGSSVVLFRGMTYNLQCVQSYSQQTTLNTETSQPSKDLAIEFNVKGDSTRPSKDLSKEECTDLTELNELLDELGPRFKDWAGREPLPVDADLLPAVVKGYKRPFRLLPYGTRKSLRDKEMTYFRRSARTMPPHFALGRNRELEGLATAMVKLWRRSAIAKIAIKRGIQNTCNERMAEELKRLTGGTLVSRNKEYIVFYRGNDFLPPGVTNKLVEAKREAALRQDEEDHARQIGLTLMDSQVKASNVGRLVAGTLAETLAATSRWANEPSSEEREKMMRENALARHASLVRFLEKKLDLAKGKVKKAENALRKVQKKLEPSQLPTDLETLTDEERFLFRKIGLSMKPFLLLGRRGVFDGTVENMHLHWKYRELVKIIVDGKSFAQVKHIAISLEAESGGILVSLDKTTKGYAIIIYRGKNYERPRGIRPKNLLTKRQALARSIELQRREALKYHIWKLEERMEKLKSELEEMKSVEEIDEHTLYSRIDNASDDDDDDDDDGDDFVDDEDSHSKMKEDEEDDEEAYLETYDSGNE